MASKAGVVVRGLARGEGEVWIACMYDVSILKQFLKQALRRTVKQVKSRQNGGFMGLCYQAGVSSPTLEMLMNQKIRQESFKFQSPRTGWPQRFIFSSFFICLCCIVKLGWAKFSPFQGPCIDCCRILWD